MFSQKPKLTSKQKKKKKETISTLRNAPEDHNKVRKEHAESKGSVGSTIGPTGEIHTLLPALPF